MTAESTESWAGWYRDRRGAEPITIIADGRQVRTRIRGVAYEGADFSVLEPTEAGGVLSSCVLEWDIPMPVHAGDTVQQATLSCLLTLRDRPSGAPSSSGRAELSLTLRCGGAAYDSGIVGAGFQDALDRIRRQMPEDTEFGGRILVNA
ncbi:DUF6304 family protein [Streptomyces sp. NBC_01498]|uniref:DUF6304 family protein n=1 Tax=Streptomyces sp. NBC_01498 TaxID=2975870 RepID=UPI002E7B92A4|nr:DUF6304 family protein [Streptomyces sp. NBC_01498]WTL24698.1 DUF6304 family protein [Streptomyces sp. NBC_01498]